MNISRWLVLLVDLILVLVSLSLAYLLRYNFHIPSIEYKYFYIAFPLLFLIRFVSFIIFKSYTGVIFHTSMEDAKKIFIAITIGTGLALMFTLGARYIWGYRIIPFSILGIDYIMSVFLLTTVRAFAKTIYLELRNFNMDRESVLIYGADELAVMTKKVLDRDKSAKYRIVGFIDDNKKNQNKRLLGVDIFHSSHFKRLLFSAEPKMVVFASDSLSGDKKQEITNICRRANVKVLNVPPLNKWEDGTLSIKQIKAIKIEDLLDRDEINIDSKSISKQLNGKVILVTGAAGSIGSELVKQIARFDPDKIVLFDQAESPLHDLELDLSLVFPREKFHPIIGDIVNNQRLEDVFRTFEPDIVYHVAAYKHVPMMERNPSEAIHTNIIGTRNLANLSVKYKVDKFVMVSTDKAVNPTNIMGATKRVSEIYTQSLNRNQNSKTKFVTTRFGNVLGSNGSVIPLFRQQIERGGPITVTHPDITRFFMTISEACQLVMEAGAMGKGGEIYVFDMGKSIKIVDLARRMIILSGLEPDKDISIVFTGLRPGEKLYEELLADKESTLPTHNSKILVARVNEYVFEKIEGQILKLENELMNRNNHILLEIIKEIVPEYTPLV